MNRKQRRAANKRGQGGGEPAASAASFRQAIGHHQRGELLEAEGLCHGIIARDPSHIGSLHLLGVIAHQRGRFDEAAHYFRKLIGVRPEVALAHQGLGSALAAGGRLAEAVTAFERAIALKSNGPAGPSADDVPVLLNLGNLYNQLGRVAEAAQCYERVLGLAPEHAEALNSLGAMRLAERRHGEASALFARALVLAPELFETFGNVATALRKANPALSGAIERAVAAWPRRLPAGELIPPDAIPAILDDPMLRCMLESATTRDLELEKFLTGARAVLLDWALEREGETDKALLRFGCSLARQCFINEYVFLETPEELGRVDQIGHALIAALQDGKAVSPHWLAAIASYMPLGSLPDPQSMLERSWPDEVSALLTQQLREVQLESQLRDRTPRLTAIVDGGSAQVRQQYEENPYPRWVLAPSRRPPVGVDEYLRAEFPWAPFRPLGERDGVDILIAGCGTGEHPIGMARRYKDARVLAVDLSLSSLGYAQRKTRELGLQNIEYAQADILELGALGRSFDLIDASGVLHHLADPVAGLRQLLMLLRPYGLMRIGLYSELGRADVVAARGIIAEQDFRPTATDIRRCRHALLDTPSRAVSRYRDFFSTSECRDLLFHVQERRLTIPQIKEMLAVQNLGLIGFELDAQARQAYRARFPDDPAMTNLDHWHAFESDRPSTFSAMYQFWCQRN